MKITILSLLVLCLSSCSGSKQDQAPVNLDNTKIDLKEAGKLIGEILEQDQNSDLINFNYEKNNQLFSTFTQTLKGHFGAQSDGALIFLSQVLKVNSLKGFESLSRGTFKFTTSYGQ